MSTTYHNPSARTFLSPKPYNPDPSILAQHKSLPSYAVTPLVQLPTSSPLSSICAPASKASKLTTGHPPLPPTHPPLPAHLLLKDESSRFSLPAFKILGASYACFRRLAQHLGLDASTTSISSLRSFISEHHRDLPPHHDLAPHSDRPTNRIRFHVATDGNFGRAVARMAGLLGVRATVYVPSNMVEKTRSLIRGEGAMVEVVQGEGGDYNAAVRAAKRGAEEGGRGEEEGLLVQDDAWEGYEEVPQWVVDGYSTMLVEIDSQVASATHGTHSRPTHLIVPVGVGSLAHAVVTHYKPTHSTPPSSPPPKIIAIEPDTAACLHKSLKLGERLTITTGDTEMCGMNCGTVSYLAWPYLRDGVDASVTVTDGEAREALMLFGEMEVRTGPCSSGTLAALLKVMKSRDDAERLGLGKDSVVVLLGTEGAR